MKSIISFIAAGAALLVWVETAQALRIEGELFNPTNLGWSVAWGDPQRAGFRVGVIDPKTGGSGRFYMELDNTSGALQQLGWFIRADMYEISNPLDRSTMGGTAYDVNVFDMHFTPGGQLQYPVRNGVPQTDSLMIAATTGANAPDAAIGYGYWASEGNGAFGVPLLQNRADDKVPATGPFVQPGYQYAVANIAQGYGYDAQNPTALNPIGEGQYAGYSPYFWTYFFPGLSTEVGDVFLANTYAAAPFGTSPFGFLDYQLAVQVTSVSGGAEVPEPASAMLFGSALIGLVAVRKKRAAAPVTRTTH